MTQNQLSENDQAMIGLLRGTPSMTVCELVEEMGVTATAVRQRLNRLMALGLVDRTHAVEGRGRPSHHYLLTEEGRKSLANNFGDLAVVLWQEVQKIDDVATRQRVISGAVSRLSEKYRAEIRGETDCQSLRFLDARIRLWQMKIVKYVTWKRNCCPK